MHCLPHANTKDISHRSRTEYVFLFVCFLNFGLSFHPYNKSLSNLLQPATRGHLLYCFTVSQRHYLDVILWISNRFKQQIMF